MDTNKKVVDILSESKIVTTEQLNEATKQAEEKRLPLAQVLVSENIVKEEALYEALAAGYQLPFIDLTSQTIRRDVLTMLPEQIIQVHHIVPFDITETEIKLATTDPDDLEIIDFTEKKTGLKPNVYYTTPSSIQHALKQLRKGLHTQLESINQQLDPSSTEDLKQLASDIPVIQLVNSILEYAVFESASDIHIEPTENETIVRYRIDGVLRQVMKLPKKVQAGVVARIKILSDLKIDEHRLPQDGRFKVKTDEYQVAFRVSILPVYDGEKAVLRLLNESAQVLTLEQLGFQPEVLDVVKRNMQKPHGMFFVSGPTGSGKTTTLYTVLNILNTPKVNVSTIEDPIEYRMPGINQTQVNPKIGMTFAAGLRSLLRQDPNIIMVGEIRDEETAEISAHAALTGHLVLSTIHTNDAVTVLPRLTEMQVPAFLIASTTNVIIAQRLVRKICSHCIESYNLSQKAITELEKQVRVDFLIKTLQEHGAIVRGQKVQDLLFYRGRGCAQCNKEGYKGRVGIYEVLEINDAMSKIIMENGTADDLRKQAEADGMITMLQDGFLKAKSGVTTIEEILRVTKE
jgi:type IV pilus assembly protein PilB